MGEQGSAPVGPDPKPEIPDWEQCMNMAKRKERSGLTLPAWQQYGFGKERLQEFEQLAASGDDPKDVVARIHCRDLSQEDFWEKYEKQGLPCVIDGIPESEGWLAAERWTYEKLC
jgi:hypothetical protein